MVQQQIQGGKRELLSLYIDQWKWLIRKGKQRRKK